MSCILTSVLFDGIMHNMTFIQRKFYLPEDTYIRLAVNAKSKNKTITQLLRELLEEGLSNMQKKNKAKAVKNLLDIADRAEREAWNGPEDLAKKHDKYFREAYQQKQT